MNYGHQSFGQFARELWFACEKLGNSDVSFNSYDPQEEKELTFKKMTQYLRLPQLLHMHACAFY